MDQLLEAPSAARPTAAEETPTRRSADGGSLAAAHSPGSAGTRGGGPVRVAIVGAGNIAETHAAVLAGCGGVDLAAVVEPRAEQGAAFARRWTIPAVFRDVSALLNAEPRVDVAHVLVPPPRHKETAEPLLAAGIDVLLEKPMAESDAQCAALQAAARRGGARLHINQNFTRHPAFDRLAQAVAAGTIGPLRTLDVEYSMPLRQLAARQFGHWMFASPRNLLLEQAVHPLSQIDALMNPAARVTVQAAPPRAVDDGLELIDDWRIALSDDKVSAGLHIRLGAATPVWQVTAVGEDGVIRADIVHNRVLTERPGRWLDAVDSLLGGIDAGMRTAGQALGNMTRYALGMTGLRPRGDPFYRSMQASLTAFYAERAKRHGTAALLGTQGRRLVHLCERAAEQIDRRPASPPPVPAVHSKTRYDTLILGGTGFIGRHAVARLRAEGQRVGVVARGTTHLPTLFADPRVGVHAGSIADTALLDDLFARSGVVVNLAHGGGTGRAGAEAAMVGGARHVAERALKAGTGHLVHVSSIAALDLSDPRRTVTGATPPDARHEARADYARAKALSELALFEMRDARHLPLTVLRPGVVVGAGTSPFHGGVGLFNAESHALGWNGGRTPLPLVLAADVADALLRAQTRPESLGGTYNLVGDVRLTAADYIAELARATGRPLRFHPGSALAWTADETLKWLVKRMAGRVQARPTWHDFRSRGLHARFDTSDVKRDLGWQPESDRDRFLAEAFAGVRAPETPLADERAEGRAA